MRLDFGAVLRPPHKLQRRKEAQKHIGQTGPYVCRIASLSNCGIKRVLSEGTPLDNAYCVYLVAQYLQGQGWHLVDPRQLADQIWRDLVDLDLSGKAAVEQVQTQVWQRYAEILHGYCTGPDSDWHDQAWTELRVWLLQQVRFLRFAPHEPEVLVQEVLVDLHIRLKKGPIRTPRAFWVYALQALRRKHVDRIRRIDAYKRGGEVELYLEGDDSSSEGHPWEEITPVQSIDPQEMENSVMNEELRGKLGAFFRAHLPTPLQREVAEAHFLDGLSLKEIARLMGKRPHEIRMVKARIVHRLRNLPPESHRSLFEILDLPDESGEEVDDE